MYLYKYVLLWFLTTKWESKWELQSWRTESNNMSILDIQCICTSYIHNILFACIVQIGRDDVLDTGGSLGTKVVCPSHGWLCIVCSCEFGDMSKSALRGLSTRLTWKIQSFSNQNHENSCFWKLSAGQKAGNWCKIMRVGLPKAVPAEGITVMSARSWFDRLHSKRSQPLQSPLRKRDLRKHRVDFMVTWSTLWFSGDLRASPMQGPLILDGTSGWEVHWSLGNATLGGLSTICRTDLWYSMIWSFKKGNGKGHARQTRPRTPWKQTWNILYILVGHCDCWTWEKKQPTQLEPCYIHAVNMFWKQADPHQLGKCRAEMPHDLEWLQ